MRLTIGMATYDDYDGVYFTVQALRLYHAPAREAEFIIVDNHPDGPAREALELLASRVPNCRYVAAGERPGSSVKGCIFEEASGDLVLVMDCHVLLVPGALERLVEYWEAEPNSRDLLQGPLLRDELNAISTHWEPQWRGGMFGTWATDPRGLDPDAEPFEIPMQGLAVFAMSRTAWPGFNPRWHGFGGEEGYLHEKVRQRGGRVLCLPFLRWVHRFQRPHGVPYPNTWDDRVRNYMLGWSELGLAVEPIETHFRDYLKDIIGPGLTEWIIAQARAEIEPAAAAA